MTDTLDAQVEAVCAARALLRSPLPHKASDIRRACLTMQLLGDGTDHVEARHMLRALDLAASEGVSRPPRLDPPPYSPQPRMIRAALLDAAILAGFGAAVFVVIMNGGPM
jgi:broad specificity phosphatase PhoE